MRKNATYSAYLLTETISDAKDLYVLIKDGLGDTVDWKKIGVTIQLFHKNGIYHSDLNCHNIMIDKNSKIWVIDFDKCDQRPINSIWPQENIDRLKRSLDKETMKYPSFMVSDSQWNAFLEGYHG